MNPPGCHRLHKPIVHTCMHVETCFHNCPRISLPDTAFFYVGHQMNQNKFQFLTNPPVTSTQCTYNTLSLIHNHSIHKPECAVTPATAHSGIYIHTNPSVEQLQQQLTQAHIYTQTQAWNSSSNSSLRHIYTHKPKRGTVPATAHSGTYIHTNPSVEQFQQQLTQAHIYTNPSVEKLQQQLTQAHIYTQTQVWNSSSNSSLRYTQTHKQIKCT